MSCAGFAEVPSVLLLVSLSVVHPQCLSVILNTSPARLVECYCFCCGDVGRKLQANCSLGDSLLIGGVIVFDAFPKNQIFPAVCVFSC